MGMLLRRRYDNEQAQETMTKLVDVSAQEDAQDKPMPEASKPEQPRRGRPKKTD